MARRGNIARPHLKTNEQTKKPTIYYTLHTLGWLLSKKTKKCWQGCGETEPLHIVGRNIKWHCTVENRFLKKLKIELPHGLTTPLLGIYPEEMKARSQRGIYTLVFIAALFTKAKSWKHFIPQVL